MVAYNGDLYRQISPYTQISCTSPIPNTLRSSEEILVELLLLCPQLLQLLVRKDRVGMNKLSKTNIVTHFITLFGSL